MSLGEAGQESAQEAGQESGVLRFDRRLGSMKVEPKPEEESDRNFPRNLHNAAELFTSIGHVDSARRLHATTSALLALLGTNPDGAAQHLLGRAAVCWACGHAGLPRNADKCHETAAEPRPVCAHCGEEEQTNFVRLTMAAADGGQQVVPWIEVRPKAAADHAADPPSNSDQRTRRNKHEP
jgi:hypothetical protein